MIEKLNKYYEDGLVTKQVHPTLPLSIWNYTPETQFQNLWDDITLQARGLVTDDNGNVVARPFKKFFNLSEGKHTPTANFEVYEKLDGSLGILFYCDNQWIMATRGSFTSDQSIRAYEMLQNYDYDRLHKSYTYLFEIIYDENRIVCKYPFEDIILLGIIDTKTEYEVDLYNDDVDFRFKNLIKNIGFKIAKRYDGIEDYNDLKQMIGDNEEGFVVKFSNGDRVKIKGDEYLRLHKIMTNVSTTAVWECLSNGDNLSHILSDVPDEFYSKIKEYEMSLIEQYNQIESEYFKHFASLSMSYADSRKDFAINSMKTKYPSILFSMLDKRDHGKVIWNILKPEFQKL